MMWQVSAIDAAGVRAAVGDWREALALALAEYRRSMYFPRCACHASKAACARGLIYQGASVLWLSLRGRRGKPEQL